MRSFGSVANDPGGLTDPEPETGVDDGEAVDNLGSKVSTANLRGFWWLQGRTPMHRSQYWKMVYLCIHTTPETRRKRLFRGKYLDRMKVSVSSAPRPLQLLSSSLDFCQHSESQGSRPTDGAERDVS